MKRNITLRWVGELDWTYHLDDASFETVDGKVTCVDVGTIYKEHRGAREVIACFPDALVEYLKREAEQTLGDEKTERFDHAERAMHRADCARRADVTSVDFCTCGHDEERAGRMA